MNPLPKWKPPPPSWANGGGIPVVAAEVLDGQIVLTLADGTRVMTHLVDIWKPSVDWNDILVSAPQTRR